MSVMKHYGIKFQRFKILLKKDNPVIAEIGSHYGEDTLRLIETFPNSKIYCFEPDDRNIRIFNKIVNDNRVVLNQSALSNKNGKARFYKSFTKYKSNILPEKYDFISYDEYHNSKSIGSIDFVWIDVQGAEYEVIDGMGSTIQNISYIWMEYGEDEYEGALDREQTINLLKSKGFKLVKNLSSFGQKGDLVFKNKNRIPS